MTNKRIAILGASGHGKVIAEIAELNGYQVCFFDDAFPDLKQLAHWQIVGASDALFAAVNEFDAVTVAIGNNSIRAQKLTELAAKQANLISLIHPSAHISQYSEIGLATVVMAGAVVNPFARVGVGAIINTSAVVEHDCVIGDYAHVSPNASLAGGCELGEGAWLGIGSCCKQLIKIGTYSVIGAGSVVVKDIPERCTAFGNPAEVKIG